MLLKFKHIRSREAINRQMMMKFNDILAQYCKEVSGESVAAVTVKMDLARCEQSNHSIICPLHPNSERDGVFPGPSPSAGTRAKRVRLFSGETR